MIAFDLKGGEEGAFRLPRDARSGARRGSLGSVETLVTHPRTTVSSEMAPEEMELAGISDGLVRWSTGVEYWKDLVEDIEQALEKV